MTDTAIRIYFGLDKNVDLDTPVPNLMFRSYREAALADFERWGIVIVDNFR